jgi:hypothetical protein
MGVLSDDRRMDDIVRSALRKWPNVPASYGWLGLDARGDWYLRDERVQAAGPFPAVKGSRIEHAALRDFICRNYACDDAGGWSFQNGPQRVYVELEAAPWVWRLHAAAGGDVAVTSHTGQRARTLSAWHDERDRLFLATDLGLGLVHTLDMYDAADAIERGLWTPAPIDFAALPVRFGSRLSPAAAAAAG